MSREQNWENLTNPADRFLAFLSVNHRSVFQGGPRVRAVVLELVGCWVFIVAWLEVKKKSCFGVKQRGPSQNPASKG